MKAWEGIAILSGMVSVAIFVISAGITYILLLLGLCRNEHIVLPIKLIIIIGIIWWFVITIFRLIPEEGEEKGIISYLISMISLGVAIITTVWVFFIKKILNFHEVEDFKDISVILSFFYGMVAMIVGVVSLFYYSFVEES